MKSQFKRKSILYVPGISEKMMRKALGTPELSGIVFDLEDSVGVAEKDAARSLVCSILQEIRGGEETREIFVRVNPLSTAFALEDLVAVAQYRPDSIIVTKSTVADVIAAERILDMLEEKYGLEKGCIGLVPLIESAQGVEEIGEIVRASRRVTAAQFGGEDFTKDMEIDRTAAGMELSYSRNRLAVVCRAAGVDCLDTPYVDFKDIAGYEADTRYAKSIGMTGRTLIHPALCELTNRIFSVSQAEKDYAQRVVAAYEQGLKASKGAVSLDGKMIDLPVYERARRTLEKA